MTNFEMDLFDTRINEVKVEKNGGDDDESSSKKRCCKCGYVWRTAFCSGQTTAASASCSLSLIFVVCHHEKQNKNMT